jgi:ribosomal protein S18 acetylase RimI-like enzyme
MSTPYTVYTLPRQGSDLILYAQKYSALVIKALTQNPAAFSSTIEYEVTLSNEAKVKRLQHPQRQILVAVATPNDGQDMQGDWLDGEWVGQVTLNGPYSKEEYDHPFTLFGPNTGPTAYSFRDHNQPAREPHAYWHMNALYVDTLHRRKGLANLICETSFQVVAAAKKGGELGDGDGGQVADLRIVIKPDNTTVIAMYESLGFKVANEKSTLAEAIAASGDLASLPSSYEGNNRYTSRGGIIMIKHIN